MIKEIDPYEYMNVILEGIKKGVLLTTKKGDKVNTMTISWGQIGIEWNTLLFTCYIRTGRFTHEQITSGEFNISIPLDRDKAKKIMAYAGTNSGKNTDKIKDLDLHLVPGQKTQVPGIKEVPLTLECKVVYQQDQDKSAIPKRFQKMYPPEVDSSFHGANRDYHTMYYGEILSAYIIED